MTRESVNQQDPATGYLQNGYDYANQAWVLDGKYADCGHPDGFDCECHGRAPAGEDCTTTGRPEGFLVRFGPVESASDQVGHKSKFRHRGCQEHGPRSR
jgi:hypothetical protein